VGLGLLGAVLFFQGLYRQLERLEAHAGPVTVELTIGEEGLTARSALGLVELPYADVQRLIATEAMWLLVARKQGHVTLPAAALDEPTRAFLRERLKAHRVRGA
jgi:hypothetical protein